MILKKILCKYFSDGDCHRVVTVRSFIIRALIYIISITSIPASYITWTSNDISLIGFYGMIGVFIEIWMSGKLIVYIYENTDIVITRCERKD